MQIRPLTIMELSRCEPLGHQFHAEKHLPGTFSIDCLIEHWTHYLTCFESMLWGAWEDDALIGGLGAVIAPDEFDGRLTAREFFWYVGRPHRGGTAGMRLLQHFHAWADQHDVESRLVRLIDEGETMQGAQLDALYTRLDYQPVEIAWIRPRKSARKGV